MNDVKLRDRRNPRHCWQDNELYDAFGPVVGPDAVLVYTHMSRHCYGTEVRSSSRELAADSLKSKNTVLRAIKAMERVGMLRMVGGGERKAAEYHLVDLKDLAMRHGGKYDPVRASYVFSAQRIRELRAMATAPPSGPVGDRWPEPSGPVGDSADPELGLHRDRSGSPQAQLSSIGKTQDIQDKTPLPPKGGDTDLRAEIDQRNAEYKAALKERNLAKAETIAVEMAELQRRRRAACGDCVDGRCTMNCGPAQKPAIPGPSPPVVGMRRRRGPSDGCSAMGATG